MKEFMKEDKPQMDVLTGKIWKAFDILRGDIDSGEYHLLLFLLVFYKKLLNASEISSTFQLMQIIRLSQFKNPNAEYNSQFIQMCNYFEPLVNKLSKKGFKELLAVLSEIDRNELKNNFKDIYDNIYKIISLSQGRFSDETLLPNELIQLMWHLAEPSPNAKIFNPFARLACLGVSLPEYQNYYGQEGNLKTWALGFLRFYAFGKKDFANFKQENSIQSWPYPSEKFDLIISTPPLNLNFSKFNIQGKFISTYQTVEQFIVEKSLNNLTDSGKLILLTRIGFTKKSNGEEHIITTLVDKDLIDKIIIFPGGILPQTNIAFALIVIDKAKQIPGKVKFIDANKFIESKGSNKKEINYLAISSFLKSEAEEESIIRVIDNNKIRDKDYNLNVASYFQKDIEGVKLGEIIQIIKIPKGNLPETGKLVRIRNLKSENENFVLDSNSIEDTELIRSNFETISESCLLLSLRWHSLKPTYFTFSGEKIYKNQDILSCSVNESLVDINYLINELNADYVQSQLDVIRRGASIPFLKKDELLNVIIKLPHIEEQKAKMQGIAEFVNKVNILQNEHNALAHGVNVNQFNEFASLKHTLGRPRQNILDWSDNLLDFLSKNEFALEKLNNAFSEFYEIDMISAVKEIKHDINFITEVLEKGENGLILSKYKKNVIPLSEISNIINSISNNGYNFTLKKIMLEDYSEVEKVQRLEERGIYANKTLLITLLDNLLTNANKYAFDKKVKVNEVIIELTEDDNSLMMEIRNNGKPFPKNFDREKFITKYSTADSQNGSGLGGYDIHRIACDFNNLDWTLTLEQDPIFPVKFNFQFPIIPIA